MFKTKFNFYYLLFINLFSYIKLLINNLLYTLKIFTKS